MGPLGLAALAAAAARAVDVPLAAPVGRTVGALVARAAAALGVPAPSPLRAVLLLVAVGATLTGLAALLPLARHERRTALAHTARRRVRRLRRLLRVHVGGPLRTAGRAASRPLARAAHRAAAAFHSARSPRDRRTVAPAAADARTLALRGTPVAEIARRTGLARDAVAIARHLAG